MRRALAAVALPLAALVLTACAGADDAADVGLVPVAEAAAKTADAGSSRIEFEVEFRGGGESFTVAGEGVFDYEQQRGRTTFDVGELAAATGGSDAGRLELVFDGLVYYMRFPSGVLANVANGRWLKVDLREAADEAGADLGALEQLDQSPTELLQFLQGASDDVDEVGTETVRGVETTHYRADVDLERAAEITAERAGLSDELREQLRREIERTREQTGLSTLPVDAWLDDEGRLRRMKMDVELDVAGRPAGMLTTMELFDFGVEVDVRPPPADEVLDIGDFAGN